MTFEEANKRLEYEYSPYYGYELDRKLYRTKKQYEKAVSEDEAKSKEALDSFGITTEAGMCEECYCAPECVMYEHLNDRKPIKIVTSCKFAIHADYVPYEDEEYTKDWTYLDWSKGR